MVDVPLHSISGVTYISSSWVSWNQLHMLLVLGLLFNERCYLNSKSGDNPYFVYCQQIPLLENESAAENSAQQMHHFLPFE